MENSKLTRVRATVNLVGLDAGQEALVDLDDPEIRVHYDAQALVRVETPPEIVAGTDEPELDEPHLGEGASPIPEDEPLPAEEQ